MNVIIGTKRCTTVLTHTILKQVSSSYRYEMVRVTENRVEPTENLRGFFNYIWDRV